MPDGALYPSSTVVTVAWLGLVLIFLASAAAKLYYKGSVDTALLKLGFASEALRKLIGHSIAPAEAVIAVWLASGWQLAASAHTALALVIVFNLMLWRLMRLGYDGGCGCFGGKSAGPVRVVHLVRNALMLVAAIVLALAASHGELATEALWSLPAEQLLSAALLLGALWLIYMLVGSAERLLFRAYWR
ncbi:MAG: MauE/DoxX family redox-associated membrane protein [Gemmatimonadota bacterium]